MSKNKGNQTKILYSKYNGSNYHIGKNTFLVSYEDDKGYYLYDCKEYQYAEWSLASSLGCKIELRGYKGSIIESYVDEPIEKKGSINALKK